jgi:prepilin-type N-terminal cleavage/methylation domain-containing protein
MRFGSIGIPAASRSSRAEARKARSHRRSSGFTLIEALVALALVLAFAAALTPHMFQARRIVSDAEMRVAAHVLLRTLLDTPFDRGSLARAEREGELEGLHWRIVAYPLPTATAGPERPAWSAYRVVASVVFGRAQMISAETVRLGRPE